MTVYTLSRKLMSGGRLFVNWIKGSYLVTLIRVAVCRHRYRKICKRINGYTDRKIRVLFMCDTVAKWKCQALYERMAKNPIFEPIVCVTVKPHVLKLTILEVSRTLEDLVTYFKQRRAYVKVAVDVDNRKFVPLSIYNPDIVFFQEPWSLPVLQTPWMVSKYALTAYVPYSYEMSLEDKVFSRRDFHSLLAYNFANNQSRVRLYKTLNRSFEYAGEIVSFGYPFFDLYMNQSTRKGTRRSVIYAPHFSLNYGTFKSFHSRHLLDLGTFEWNGKEILSYAKLHPEIDWVFKPHPTLREHLVMSGFMSIEECDEYYLEWERCGQVCYDGDYIEKFMSSDVLITDSGSFLIEYLPTGKPIIRLKPEDGNGIDGDYIKPVLDTYYTVSNLVEMYECFSRVIEKGEDPKHDERIIAAKKLNLLGEDVSGKIVLYLENKLNN